MSDELERIEGRTFGPSDTVVIDGKLFVSCFFDRCEIVYYGGSTHIHVGCSLSGCRVTFFDAAWRTAQILMRLGYTLTSSAGENPEAQFIQ